MLRAHLLTVIVIYTRVQEIKNNNNYMIHHVPTNGGGLPPLICSESTWHGITSTTLLAACREPVVHIFKTYKPAKKINVWIFYTI